MLFCESVSVTIIWNTCWLDFVSRSDSGRKPALQLSISRTAGKELDRVGEFACTLHTLAVDLGHLPKRLFADAISSCRNNRRSK